MFSFHPEIAVRFGVEEAVFIHNLFFWIKKNKANGRHFYDGLYWTYNSKKAYTKLFPFWTDQQLRRIIGKLLKDGVIKSGNYNQVKFDRTQWLAIIDDKILNSYGDISDDESILPNEQMHLSKPTNGVVETNRTIPYINTYIKKDKDTPPDKSGSSGIDFNKFIDKFNSFANRKFRVTKEVKRALIARIKSGYTPKEVIQAIENAHNDEYHKESNFKYLTPEYILRPGQLEKFLNAPSVNPLSLRTPLNPHYIPH